MNKVHAIQDEIPFEKPAKKKCVEYLYIEADEDHIHKQEKTVPEKKRGMIGKLLYLYEGREEKYGRKELKNVFYLGGLYAGGEENHRLFRRMQKYIETNYETKYLQKVYVSGDCGAWIKAGVADIDKGVMVMDKYHLMKYINKAANQMLDDANEVKGKLWKALYKGKKKKFVKVLKAVRKCVPNPKPVDECEEYVLNNWDSAVLRMQDKNVYGCSFFKIRNGVETLPSLLRRQYHADRMLVRGLIRGRFFFGCKIGALNFKKLFTYRKGLGHYAQNPVLA